MSFVWKFFKINKNVDNKADCTICGAVISRGGKISNTYNTSNMIKHLKVQHPTIYADCISKKEQKQPTIDEFIKMKQKMSRDCSRSIQITDSLMKFVAIDDQPLSVVNNVGFRQLIQILEPRYDIPSQKYLTDVTLPKLYDITRSKILTTMQNEKYISFTTDIWSSDFSTMSIICLTSQWITDDFKLKKAVLALKKFRGSHNGEAISTIIGSMLTDWNILKSSIHAFITDNAKNMIKGMNNIQLPNISCFSHSIQLIVREGVLNQQIVIDTLKKGRKIVGHFKHSQLAYSRLEDIQIRLNESVKRLQQDVPTRWNSTFTMVQSIVEQKITLQIYSAEFELPCCIMPQDWNVFEKILEILGPFEELTRKVCAAVSKASDVIPFLAVL